MCYCTSLMSQTAFSVFICGGRKRVWSNDQGGLVSRMPRFSRCANHSDHTSFELLCLMAYSYPRVIRNLSCTGGVNVKCYKRCNTNSYWAFDQTLYFLRVWHVRLLLYIFCFSYCIHVFLDNFIPVGSLSIALIRISHVVFSCVFSCNQSSNILLQHSLQSLG